MKLVDQLTYAHGWISDKDFIWWPFSFLRPEKNVPMSFKLVCLMTLCFAGLSYLMYLGYSVVNNAFDGRAALEYFLMFFGGFFTWFNVVTKPLWNRRVKLFSLRK